MDDTSKAGKDELPGNHGQFGADIETENYESLPDLDVTDPEAPAPGAQDAGPPGGEAAPDVAGDAEAAPGQHQEQGGMRS